MKPGLTTPQKKDSDAKFRVGERVTEVYGLSPRGFSVLGNGASTGSIHEGILELPGTGVIPLRVRVRTTTDDETTLSFWDLSLVEQKQLKQLLARHQSERPSDPLEELTYDQISEGVAEPSPVPAATPFVEVGDGDAPLSSASTKAATPLPMATPKAAPKPAGPKKSTGIVAVFILVIGVVAILVAGLLYFRNHLTIPIQNAVVLGNLVPVKAPSNGVVDQLLVADGQLIEKGDPLFRIVDQRVETDYVATKAALAAAEVEKQDCVKGVEQALDQQKVMAAMFGEELAVAQSALAVAKAEERHRRSMAERLKPLAKRRVITQATADEAIMAHDAALGVVELRHLEIQRLKQREKALKDRGILMVGDRVDDALPRANARLAKAEAEMLNLQENLAHFESLREKFIITATDAGSVYASYLKEGSFVRAGGEVLALSTTRESWAIGHVTQKKALKVMPGQSVKVSLRSMGGKRMEGKVTAIGHRGVYSQNGWNPDFRADPALVPIKVSLPDTDQDIPTGLRISMVIELDFEWPWERGDDESEGNADPENPTLADQS